MYLVGHAIIAFLIAYGISRKFKTGGISFAMVMLIACLPDIDILLESAGITSHKTYTHSLILSVTVVPAIIFGLAKLRRTSSVAALIYSLSYISHIVIGDITVGSTNILYPFGNMMVGIGIGYGTLSHQIVELLSLAVAAAIILFRSFKAGESDETLFRYNLTDRVSYLLVMGSLILSFGYLLYGLNTLPRLFIETDLEMAVFILLHMSAAALVAFLAFASRHLAILRSKEKAAPNSNK